MLTLNPKQLQSLPEHCRAGSSSAGRRSSIVGSSRAFSSVGFKFLGFRFKELELQGVRFSDSGLLGV